MFASSKGRATSGVAIKRPGAGHSARSRFREVHPRNLSSSDGEVGCDASACLSKLQGAANRSFLTVVYVTPTGPPAGEEDEAIVNCIGVP